MGTPHWGVSLCLPKIFKWESWYNDLYLWLMCVPQIYFDKWVVINDPLIAFRSFQGHTKPSPSYCPNWSHQGSTSSLRPSPVLETGYQDSTNGGNVRCDYLNSSCSAWFLYGVRSAFISFLSLICFSYFLVAILNLVINAGVITFEPDSFSSLKILGFPWTMDHGPKASSYDIFDKYRDCDDNDEITTIRRDQNYKKLFRRDFRSIICHFPAVNSIVQIQTCKQGYNSARKCGNALEWRWTAFKLFLTVYT